MRKGSFEQTNQVVGAGSRYCKEFDGGFVLMSGGGLIGDCRLLEHLRNNFPMLISMGTNFSDSLGLLQKETSPSRSGGKTQQGTTTRKAPTEDEREIWGKVKIK